MASRQRQDQPLLCARGLAAADWVMEQLEHNGIASWRHGADDVPPELVELADVPIYLEDEAQRSLAVALLDEAFRATPMEFGNGSIPKCLSCGYDLRGHSGDGDCPECGHPFRGSGQNLAKGSVQDVPCPECGVPVPDTFDECWRCGASCEADRGTGKP